MPDQNTADKKRKNRHGLMWKKNGNFLYVYRKDDAKCVMYVKWLHQDLFTEEILNDDFDTPFPLVGPTEEITFRPLTEKGVVIKHVAPADINDIVRVNKHGVEFRMNGVKFVHEDFVYEMGLPFQCDMSHLYTPALLVRLMNEFGTYSQHSQMWVRPGVKNKAQKTLWD